MQALFESLTTAVDGSMGPALAAAFAWGILSIVLSPCHLASLPLIVAFIGGTPNLTRGRAVLLSVLFSLGILVTIAAIGALTAAAGRILGDIGSVGNYLVATLLIVLGLELVGVIRLPWGDPARPGMRARGAGAAFVMGLVFGVALGPCTFAFLAPMLAVAFRVATDSPMYGGALLAMYGLGHCAILALAGASAEWTQRSLDWSANSRGGRALRTVCGVLVIVAGLYLIWSTH